MSSIRCLFSCMIFFFFFKQKTAYEMLRSLVGSEMCIRDRSIAARLSSQLNDEYSMRIDGRSLDNLLVFELAAACDGLEQWTKVAGFINRDEILLKRANTLIFLPGS
eukprot:TRINITY_DN2986_c0_g1_i16.p1 TRINITY_DN2986_c0_g1~~TRINITY_DN2986_c0_g1_i16.p1  ORF type:complete len:107 (+),score=11.35 TRINITY_DN2986_c0_g1_i16:42-362(+)